MKESHISIWRLPCLKAIILTTYRIISGYYQHFMAFCDHLMEPCYDNKHRPVFWQECPTCGHIYDMRGYEEDE